MINALSPFSRVSTESEKLKNDAIYLPQKQQIKSEILIISHSREWLENIDQALNTKENDSNLSASTLAMISMQQKQVVLAMLGVNSEQAIAKILEDSIGIYGKRLEQIYGWTNGGVDMFRSSLMVMLKGIQDGGVKPTRLEDLFQLAILEAVCNAQEYGLEDWYKSSKEDISHILESTGSGSHGVHEGYTAEVLAKATATLYDGMKSQGNIPKDSFLGEILLTLDSAGGKKALSDQIINGWNDDTGWWIQPGVGIRAEEISPMTRLFILSSLLNKQSMTQEQINLVLTANLAELDKFILIEFGIEGGKDFSPALEVLVSDPNNQWRMLPDGRLDWLGIGIDMDDLTALYKFYPARELTKEELEEINRIGDQIKMIQQTLKYWVQICSDERLAIARNI
ncbi:hypothetical protein [Yersinia enterocolitica]|uniref:hypothetical protein n=1 Tax=Yersinia enterocolitica TaxID=630 RepID=UPI00094BB280|nr:hypothetical protein [Yersinia enterocolitica]